MRVNTCTGPAGKRVARSATPCRKVRLINRTWFTCGEGVHGEEGKEMPRDVCTMAKGVRCGKPFSMNEMLERGGEKAKARRRSSLLGRSTGWLMQPIDGGLYNPMYRMPW